MSSAQASAATATDSLYFLLALYCSAPPAFYWFAELVVAALFPVLHLAFGPAVRVLQRPHFFPNDKPSSVAQTAHCVRIILRMVQSLGGALRCKKHRPDSLLVCYCR